MQDKLHHRTPNSLAEGRFDRLLMEPMHAKGPFPGTMLIMVTSLLLWATSCSTPPLPPPALVREAPLLPKVVPVVEDVRANPVVLVEATSSAPSEPDRRYAEKITARMSDWLQSYGIPATTVTDDHVARGLFPKTSVIILPCNPNPGTKELLALHRFVAKGGKLIVLYSADASLASLMGFKMGQPKSAAGSAGWTGFHFTTSAPSGVPPRIEQDSLNIRPVYPDRPDAKVIAWWSSPNSGSRDPAWLQSANGFWMSHILQESDVAAKKQMLATFLGACDPALLKASAAFAVNHAGTLGISANSTSTISAIQDIAGNGGQTDRVKALLKEAANLRSSLAQDYRAGRYIQVLQQTRRLDAILTEAFARTQSPCTDEFRGVWNHAGTGFTPDTWEETCEALARNGMTAVLPNIQRPWCAHYPSKWLPPSDAQRRYGNQLKACLTAAHRYGLETHAWVILWNLEGAPEPVVNRYRQAGRLQVMASGQTVSWLCPSHPDNRAFELTLLRELASLYPDLDGIQLDYIRYKSLDTCYCAGCRNRFEHATGMRAKHWPADVRSGSLAPTYRHWRQSQITSFVADIRREMKRINPRLRLSASVYAGYPGCADSIAQDWVTWVRQGYVDFVCPMNYTATSSKFMDWYQKQTAYPGIRGKLFAGIGITSLECRLNAVQTIDQISRLRRAGAQGFTLFEANPTLASDVLPYLGMGITSKH